MPSTYRTLQCYLSFASCLLLLSRPAACITRCLHRRYVMWGDITARAAAELRRPEVSFLDLSARVRGKRLSC